jgi:hypothetical protein
MFIIYKKVISPDTSPALGPANATPPTIAPKEDPQPSYLANMEPFSLCNYCCSARPKQGTNPDPAPDPKQDPKQGPKQDPTPDPKQGPKQNPTPDPKQDPKQDPPPKYEFGHATHYKYNATTPRVICEFETGTP